MWKRNTFVQHIDVFGLQSSSVLHIGDSNQILSESNALAVQREWEIFYGNEGALHQYPLFSEPLPDTKSSVPPPLIRKYNTLPNINVGNIKIKGISASAVVQVGNTANVNMQSRVLHIRQLSSKSTSNIRKEE